jgi:gamma-glutamyl-gamma-aminobutyrate hydrolase PuuD
MGVQWHPELLVFSAPQQRLFQALAEAARECVAPFRAESRAAA